MTLRALIFDVDGTLAETERDGHRVAFNHAFSDAGFDWYWSETFYSDLLGIGGGRERIVSFLKHYQTDISLHDAEETSKLIDELHQAKAKNFRNIVKAGKVKLRPGIKRIMHEARQQGLQLAVATNCSPVSLNAICESQFGTTAENCFDVIVTGDLLEHKKPDPQAYALALEKLDMKANECVAFEDSNIGLRSALSNGIATVVTVASYTEKEDFSGANLILSSLGEPLEINDHADARDCSVLGGTESTLMQGHDHLSIDVLEKMLA